VTRARRIAGYFALSLFGAALAGCDGLLAVKDPDIIDPGDLDTFAGAVALYAGAIADFALARDGGAGPAGALGIVAAGGWFTDEYTFAGTATDTEQMDLRAVSPSNAEWGPTYLNLHRAVAAAERAARSLEAHASNPAGEPRIGEMFALSALTQVLLGEHYCSGIPFSATEPALSYGRPLTTSEVFARAIGRLDSADAHQAGDPRTGNLAKVVRGRALLDLGQADAAAAVVASVPTAFEYRTYHSVATERQVNYLYVDNFEQDRLSVADREGRNGLDFATAGDPRVPTQLIGVSHFDLVTPMYRYLVLGSRSASVVAASGIEARLIEAEASLVAGRAGGWLGALDRLRAGIGLPPLVDPGTRASQVDLHFRERAFWLFSQGYRLGDLRRLVRQYGRLPETVFPTGPYHKDNRSIGRDVDLVIPDSERNNPNFTGCLSRDG
jgi:hypothetical protein